MADELAAGSSSAPAPAASWPAVRARRQQLGARPKGHAKGPGAQLGGQLAAVGDRPAARRSEH